MVRNHLPAPPHSGFFGSFSYSEHRFLFNFYLVFQLPSTAQRTSIFPLVTGLACPLTGTKFLSRGRCHGLCFQRQYLARVRNGPPLFEQTRWSVAAIILSGSDATDTSATRRSHGTKKNRTDTTFAPIYSPPPVEVPIFSNSRLSVVAS